MVHMDTSRHDIVVELSEIGKIVKALHKKPKHGPPSPTTVASLTAQALEIIDRRLAAIEGGLSRLERATAPESEAGQSD